MKRIFAFIILIILSQSAFAMSTLELTRIVISNKSFMEAVEARIKNSFRKPEEVKLYFVDIGAQMDEGQYFQVKLVYYIEAEKTVMGMCKFVMQGKLEANNLVTYDKIIYENCGE